MDLELYHSTLWYYCDNVKNDQKTKKTFYFFFKKTLWLCMAQYS